MHKLPITQTRRQYDHETPEITDFSSLLFPSPEDNLIFNLVFRLSGRRSIYNCQRMDLRTCYQLP